MQRQELDHHAKFVKENKDYILHKIVIIIVSIYYLSSVLVMLLPPDLTLT